MKKLLFFCYIVLVPASLSAQQPSVEISEEKVTAIFEEYMACINRCEHEKDHNNITNASYEYIKKRCQDSFVQLLLSIEQEENNK